MSENSEEYNKRTCIICGCHTSETINIYEPRTGPNIVQLIQARFKFQPLNDDKYLCYSCNNWLINWHSLQTLNINKAYNSPSPFHSSHQNNTKSEMSSSLNAKLNIQSSKPIAIVRPRMREHSSQQPKNETSSINEKLDKRINTNLDSLTLQRQKRVCQRKNLSRRKVLRSSRVVPSSLIDIDNCKNSCDAISSPDDNSTAFFKTEIKSPESNSVSTDNCFNLVNRTLEENSPLVKLPYLPRQNQRILIDGKVVSMLRRIGTTLSRDLPPALNTYQPSEDIPKMNTQIWTREVEDDEILINFNTAISEVLPYNKNSSSYDVTKSMPDTIGVCGNDDDLVAPNLCKNKIDLQQVYNLLPKGLSVSLISNPDGIC